ncbi:MAG TPA: acyloxyacyl hydrolase [Sphingomicrobium sp.]|nr:acyloxyacyl hydrolase [Sphingomicrobium sp.]
MNYALITAAAVLAATAAPAQAGELFGGLFIHDVKTPLNLSGVESGMDAQIGWRGGRIGKTPLQPYLFGSLNSAGNTHYVAAGISAKFGDRLYIRPGVGIAVHSGSAANFDNPFNDRVEFGSRILFEPELGIGTRLNERMTIEASLVHLSQGQVFGRQNPGIDNIGIRLNYAL